MPKKTPTTTLHELTKNFGPKVKQAWSESSFSLPKFIARSGSTPICGLFSFVLQHKADFIADSNGQDNTYYKAVEAIWNAFSDTEINTPAILQRTMLMRALHFTQDPNTILFSVTHTSEKGMNAYSPDAVHSQHYALSVIIQYGIRGCIDLALKKSGYEALKEARKLLKTFQRFNTKPQYQNSCYSNAELSSYLQKIDTKMRWAIFPGGLILRSFLVADTSDVSEAANSSVSSTSITTTKEADHKPLCEPTLQARTVSHKS